MSSNQIRMEVANLYSGENWKRKVGKMPEHQVLAIYMSMKKRKDTVKVPNQTTN